jgi:hypothetical protein
MFTFGNPAEFVEPVGSIKSPESKNKKATAKQTKSISPFMSKKLQRSLANRRLLELYRRKRLRRLRHSSP